MSALVSVVVPVYNSAHYLEQCLGRLAQSSEQPFECIVVDDGSTDSSVEVAQCYGAKVLSTEGRRGPSFARNLGARQAQGDIIFFIDADVCVHQDTVARLMSDFDENPEVDALIGSYDTLPASPDFLSQYRNLMHCFVHQNARSEACTFWSGCGAIRKDVFLQHSGFDESYGRPAIEDIELGFRLKKAGCKLMLDRNLQVKHLKRWTFWNLMKTDMLDRGIPWTELILRDRQMPNDLNLQISQRISVALVFLLLAVTGAAAILGGGYVLAPLFALALLLLGRYWIEASSEPGGRAATISMGLVLGLTCWLLYEYGMGALAPPLLMAYLLLFLRHRYGFDAEKRRRITGLLYGIYLGLSILFVFTYLPAQPLVFAFFFIVMVIALLNLHFYIFLAQRLGRLCVISAIPFHLFYHFYNGISFLAGATRFYWRTRHSRKPVFVRTITRA